MPNNNDQNLPSEAVPFFARYLEGQMEEQIEEMSDEDLAAVSGGQGMITLAYPNDNPGLPGGNPVTLAYPSDFEGLPICDPITMRYPSDVEGGPVTLKYPSDHE
jgi:bacteriocin-like protein